MAGSSVIGALRVNLGLDSAQFSTGIKRAQGDMAGLAARIGKIAGGMAAGLKAAGVAMSVSAVNAGAEVKRLSQVANTSTDQFQGWVAGAKSVGIEQEKLGDILKDVNDRVGDFVQTGGGPMADFFEKIAPKVGVTAQMFRNLSGADALQLYVSTLQKANVNQQDFTFYMEAMASDSTLLLPLLKDNGKGMAEFAQRARDMGAIMSGETLAALDRGKQSLSDMQLAVQGMRNTIGATAVPALQALALAATSVATFFHQHAATIASALKLVAASALAVGAYFAGGYAIAVGVTAVKAMAAAVGQSIALEMALGAQSRAAAVAGVMTKALAGALGILKRAIIATGIGAIVVAAGYLITKFVDAIQITGSLGGAFVLLGEVAKGVWEGIKTSANSIPLALSGVWWKIKGEFFSLIDSMLGAWGRFLKSMGDIAIGSGMTDLGNKFYAGMDEAFSSAEVWGTEAADATGTSNAKFAEAGAALAQGWDEAAAAMARLNLTAEEAESSVGGVLNAGGGGDAGGGGAKGKLSDLQKVMKDLADQASRLKATMWMSDLDASIWDKQREAGVAANSTSGKQIDGIMRQIDGMQRLKDATNEWRDSIKSAFSSFITQGGSFKKVLSDIVGKLAEMMFSKAFDGLWGSIGGRAGGFMKMLGFANGTNFAPGGLARVHERGGEIMNLPRGTQVIPHDISKRMADGAAKGASAGIRVEIGASEYFDARVFQISGAGDARMAQVQQRALPGQIRNNQARGIK